MKSVIREAKREVEDNFGTKPTQNFKGNRMMFWREAKRMRKGIQGEKTRVWDKDGNMLVEGKAVRHR